MKDSISFVSLPVWYGEMVQSILNEPSVPPLSSLSAMIPEFEMCEWTSILLPPALYFSYSSLYYFLSLMKLTSIELHRIPTNQPGRRPNKVTVEKVVRACIFTSIIQVLTATFINVMTRPDDMSQRRMESWPVVFMKIAAGAVMLDTYEYWVHRWFHENRFLYRWIHSVHHELTSPFAFGALYNHPLESFFMDIIGSGLTSVILNMHPWTAAMFFSISTLKTVDDHCGYTFPWHPLHVLFPNNAKFHDIHHWGKGVRYNYSQPFFTWWDHLMGTEFESAMARKKKDDPKFQPESEEDEDHEEDVKSLLKSMDKDRKSNADSELRNRAQKANAGRKVD